MKDYIYLDMELANSYLAQIDEGILTKMVHGNSSSDSHQENGGETITSEGGMSLGIPAILGGNGKFSKTEVDTFAEATTKTANSLVETAINDFAIDLLIDKLTGLNLKEKLTEADEGDFILFETPFKFYDFKFMNNCIDLELFELLGVNDGHEQEINRLEKEIKEYDKKLKLLKKPNNKKNLPPNARDQISILESQITSLKQQLEDAKQNDNIFFMIEKLTNFGDSLFPNSVLLSSEGYLSYCSREKFRISQAQLSAISDSKRDIYILATVSNSKESVNKNGNMDDFTSMDLNLIPTMFSEVILGQFNLLMPGDKILRPIAIYFDQF